MKFQIEWFDRVSSTNTVLRERFQEDPALKSGHIVATREQTHGRGRQGRTWVSGPRRDLCFSLLVLPGYRATSAPSLPMAASLAVSECLNALNVPAAPKWPNDVLVGDEKICGILSEVVECPQTSRTGILVGIGLNVNMSIAEAAAIDRPVTSLSIATGAEYDATAVLDALLHPLAQWIERWMQGGFGGLRETWSERAGPIGKAMAVHDGNTKTSGTLAGFGDQGELLLQTDAGLKTILAGDTFNL
ncbi:MAG: biotin--[acetyl-CoA-carboxylase] ligase [Verrucomicrobia bacterium]|nr:biotin--[acetyl-CoA-carboxylase] ligase [Verrucomicrobiota bacterium]